MKSLLFGVSATDPLTFSSVAIFLTLIALLAVSFRAPGDEVDPNVSGAQARVAMELTLQKLNFTAN